MKVSVDGQDLFELTEIQKQVMQNNIMSDIFENDLKRRLQWVLIHKYEQCFKELKEEWDVKLADRVDEVPTNPEAYAKLVFSQPDYCCRKTREDNAAAERAKLVS